MMLYYYKFFETCSQHDLTFKNINLIGLIEINLNKTNPQDKNKTTTTAKHTSTLFAKYEKRTSA